jgi:hypothetical protein
MFFCGNCGNQRTCENGSGETAKKASQFLGAIRTNMFIVGLVVAESVFCKTYSLSMTLQSKTNDLASALEQVVTSGI